MRLIDSNTFRGFFVACAALMLLSVFTAPSASARTIKRSALNASTPKSSTSDPEPKIAKPIGEAKFEEPNQEEISRHSALVEKIDPQGSVPKALLQKTLAFFEKNKARIKNKRYLGIVDFAQHSSKKRFYIVDLEKNSITRHYTAHGKGSDKNADGIADTFSNTESTNASSLGYYLTDNSYFGKHGRSLRLDGLSPSNSNARKRAIVLHSADYMKDAPVKQGRSFGCFVVPKSERDQVIDILQNGALIYADKAD